LYEAEIVTVVEKMTREVFTVKAALVAPSGTVTPGGTRAAAVLLLESATLAPPGGAGPFSVTVPAEDSRPPVTLAGLSVSEERVGGSTVTDAVRVRPPQEAKSVTWIDAGTALVLTVKVALAAPAGTIRLEGTVAAASLLETETTAPLLGAGELSVTVPVEE
jgi:hypothetical protein